MFTQMKTPAEKVVDVLSTKTPAIIVGNGINRFSSLFSADYSWDSLIMKLWSNLSKNAIPFGEDFNLTEAYDIINLYSVEEDELRNEVKAFVKSIRPTGYQRKLSESMLNRDLPILTTNYDSLLEQGLNDYRFKEDGHSFTDYYPWSVYFSDRQRSCTMDGFGVWHINGMVKYPRSMRLGLTHYMQQVSRVKSFLHSGDMDDFRGKNQIMWRGYTTWLHIFFNRNLLILGLKLDVNEVFLRWLLIEREKYYNRYNDRRKFGWFLCNKAEMTLGKRFFLESLGFEIIQFDDFNPLYESVLG